MLMTCYVMWRDSKMEYEEYQIKAIEDFLDSYPFPTELKGGVEHVIYS